MNQMTRAMLELADMDELASLPSFLQKRHPLGKLFVVILYIFAVVSFPKENVTGLLPMVLVPVLWYQLAGIPVGTCFYKLRFILPLICAVGIWNPLLDRRPVLQLGGIVVSAGMLSFLTLLLKGIFALMASFLLIATTKIEKLCYALRLLRLPEIVATQLLITYRYISLLLREAGTMWNAYALRAPGQKGLHISAWGSFVGQLLLRSMDRAGELFQSMQLRGFCGDFYYAGVKPWSGGDTVFVLVSAAVILLLRWVNLSLLLGGAIL